MNIILNYFTHSTTTQLVILDFPHLFYICSRETPLTLCYIFKEEDKTGQVSRVEEILNS